MAILGACCWWSIRRGAFASVFYSLVSNWLNLVSIQFILFVVSTSQNIFIKVIMTEFSIEESNTQSLCYGGDVVFNINMEFDIMYSSGKLLKFEILVSFFCYCTFKDMWIFLGISKIWCFRWDRKMFHNFRFINCDILTMKTYCLAYFMYASNIPLASRWLQRLALRKWLRSNYCRLNWNRMKWHFSLSTRLGECFFFFV